MRTGTHRLDGQQNGQDGGPRDLHGRFTLGNPGGPGRPRRATEATYLLALSDACPPETWQRICQKAVEQAIEGDASARAWLSKYLAEGMTLNVAAHLAESAP